METKRKIIDISKNKKAIFYLNEQKTSLYQIKGTLKCWVYEGFYGTMRELIVTDGSVSGDSYGGRTYFGNAFRFFKNQKEGLEFLKERYERKVTQLKVDVLQTEAQIKNLEAKILQVDE